MNNIRNFGLLTGFTILMALLAGTCGCLGDPSPVSLQFQFMQALCDTAGHEGPLHECSFYGSKAAGEKLNAMLSAGQSMSWVKPAPSSVKTAPWLLPS
jgi:hypothetical protein